MGVVFVYPFLCFTYFELIYFLLFLVDFINRAEFVLKFRLKFANLRKIMLKKMLFMLLFCGFCVDFALAKAAENNASSQSTLLEFERKTKHLSAKSTSAKARKSERVKIPTH